MKVQLLFSLGVQIYIALLGLLLLPLYLHLLGKEAFGLIGFFLVMQTMLQLLDLGFTSALSREMARFRAGVLSANAAAERLRALEWLFALIGLLAIVFIFVFHEFIAEDWLTAESLSADTLAFCLFFMVVAVVLRWFSGLYRGVLAGLEKQRLINSLLTIFVTLRFVAVLPVLWFIDASPEAFFVFQLMASVLEFIAYYFFVRRLISPPLVPWLSLSALGALWPIVGSMAFLNILWILQTNIDKFLFSGILPLAEYGTFTLAVSLAATILALLLPFNQVVQPRLSYLFASGDNETFQELYQLVSQVSAVLFITVGGTLAFFAEPIVLLWTGDANLAATVASIVFWYALANALTGVSLSPFMLQFAQGRLRLHILGAFLFFAFTVPAVIMAGVWSGPITVGQVLMVSNLIFITFWLPIVHYHFLPALTWRWSWQILSLVVILSGWLWLARWLMPEISGLWAFIWIALTGFSSLILGALLAKNIRPLFLQARVVLKKIKQ